MEQVCSAFHNYDFLSDAEFVGGWSNLSLNIPPEKREEELTKAKLFYFSRTFQPISLDVYHQWLSRLNGQATPYSSVVDYSRPLVYSQEPSNTNPSGRSICDADLDPASGDSEMDTLCADDFSRLNISDHVATAQEQNLNNSSLIEHGEPTTRTDAMESAAADHTVVDHAEEPKYPVTFYDLMWMIEKGEPIPGVDNLDIEPTNETPTSSNLNRAKKPWEL